MAAYDHTQRGPWHVLTAGLGAVLLLRVARSAAREGWEPRAHLPLLLAAAALLALAAMTARLRVRDEGDGLSVRFCPLPLLGTKVPYESIESVECCRISLLDGWGMHGWPGGRLVINIWGFDAVRLDLRRPRGLLRFRTYLIGTDEPGALMGFLRERTGQDATDETGL